MLSFKEVVKVAEHCLKKKVPFYFFFEKNNPAKQPNPEQRKGEVLSTCKQLPLCTAPCTTKLQFVPGFPPATGMAMLILFLLIIKMTLPLQNTLSEWCTRFELYSCVGSTPC